MFREVYTQPLSDIRQSSVGGIENSVCTPAAAEDSPSAFSNTARQRMRKQCFSPKRNPFSSARRSTSVNSNTFGFPIVYKTEKDNKYFM